MLAVFLHKKNSKIKDLQAYLQYENIIVRKKVWRPEDNLTDIFDANIIALYCSSPDAEILSIIPGIRKIKYSLPIVVIDENEDSGTKIKTFDQGADAYFSRPINYKTLAVQLKSIVCKRENFCNDNKWMRAFDIWLDIGNHFVKRNKNLIPLRNKEFALLEFFMINRGKVLTRNSILEHVWDRNTNLASNTVDVHINRLRKKIENNGSEKLIHTIHCIGYIFDKKKNKL